MESLRFEIDYSWEPFTFGGAHLTFQEHSDARLSQDICSHWGVAVYKWEGPLTEGTNVGKVGVLIGETENLRQRIKQYISGTQKSENKYWREQFLTRGPVRLYVLRFINGKIQMPAGSSLSLSASDLNSNNVRLVVEQLLVLKVYASAKGNLTRWIVNRKL